MKTLIAILLLSSVTLADQQFTFKYTYQGRTLEIRSNANTHSWEEAYTSAALKCYEIFTKNTSFNKEDRTEIINVCANPRK